ncbi:Ig-like domain-containing protein [Paenibacillus sp. GCM10027626]|uniref:Ig-like domain-containing protein n=1 Tax=Paenibacillus sp. GCM10027626 TaxID=3273411 RepID=UPI003636EA02
MMKRVTSAALRPFAAAGIAVILLLAALHNIADAADEVVTGVHFETVPSPAVIYIDDETVVLRANASIQGATSAKDVTLDAAWSSSNTSAIKVDKGVLTAIASGTSTIRAQYKGYTATVVVTSEYKFDRVTLLQNGAAVNETEEVKLGDNITYTLQATKDNNNTDVTKLATWTTSNDSVATVTNGKIKLLAAGEATITAKYKGRSDKVKLKIESPFNKLNLSGGKLIEFKIGDAEQSVTAAADSKTGGTVDVTTDATWTSSAPAVATVKKGVIAPVGSGTATITAEHLGVKSSVTVVVRPPYEAMRLTPSQDQHVLLKDKDTPIQFMAEVMNHPEAPIDVTASAVWTSDNVFAATVSDTGLVAAKGIGRANIKAEYKGSSKQIAIIVYPSVTKLSAAETKVEAFVGEKIALPAISATTLSDETADVSAVVNWSSSNNSVVTLEDDKWVAKDTGIAMMTATLDGKAVSVKVVVSEKPLLLVADVSDLSVILGKDTPLPKVNVTYESGKEEDVSNLVTWKSSSNNVLVKAPILRGLVKSNATLTASYLGKTTTVRVTVEEEITKIYVDATSIVLNPGRSKSIKVTGVTKSGKSVSLSTKMNWTLDSDTLATVKGSTVKALAEGTGKLTGSYQGKPVQVTLIVKPKLKKLTLSDRALTMSPGSSNTLKLTAEYDNGKLIDVTAAGTVWTSSSSSVATVKNGVITAGGKGSTTIKASFEGKTASIRITVK